QESTEMGNIAFGLKSLLYSTECSALSAGLLVEAPTSGDFFLIAPTFPVTQDAWCFTPYLAALSRPTENLFVQGFASYRMPAAGEQLIGIANMREPHILMLDASAGYWLVDNCCDRVVTALAPTIELHYTTPMDIVEPGGLTGSQLYGRRDDLELTAGMTAVVHDRATVSAGFAFPLRSNFGTAAGATPVTDWTDRMFDWSFMLQVNVFRR
ncbi:MAG: hypothetical protein KDA41_11290, partial [Planctomycetales bacterium]|nr:hypothetical protein [Planctomycetales bacterium]